jgi:amino acid transporter
VLLVAQSARAGLNTHFAPGRFAGAATPWRIMVVMAAAMSAATALTISPTLGRQFQVLINVSTVWCIIPYAVCCLALWRLARGRLAEKVAAALALVFNGWLLWTSDVPTRWLTAGLFVLVGLGWLWARTRTTKAGKAHGTA